MRGDPANRRNLRRRSPPCPSPPSPHARPAACGGALTAAAVATAGAALAGARPRPRGGRAAGRARRDGADRRRAPSRRGGGRRARTGLTLAGHDPRDRLGAYAEGAGRRGGPARLLRDPAVSRIDFARAGRAPGPRLHPRATSIFTSAGTVAVGELGAVVELALDHDELPGRLGHLARELSGQGRRSSTSEFDTEHPDLKPKLADRQELRLGHRRATTPPTSARDLDIQHRRSTARTSPAWSAAASDNANGVPGSLLRLRRDPLQDRLRGGADSTRRRREVRARPDRGAGRRPATATAS